MPTVNEQSVTLYEYLRLPYNTSVTKLRELCGWNNDPPTGRTLIGHPTPANPYRDYILLVKKSPSSVEKRTCLSS